MSRRACAVLAAVLIAVAAGAEAAEPAYVRFSNGIGFSAGRISGTGISYRKWFTEKVGIQVCAGALYSGVYSSDVLEYWTGVEVMRSLYATEFTRWLFGQVYLFAGLSHYGTIPWEATDDTYTEYEPGAYVPGFGLGGGVGIEMALFKHFSLAFELGYAAFWEGTGEPLLEELSVDLIPQGIFQFRF